MHPIFGVAESLQAMRELAQGQARRPVRRRLCLGWICAALVLLGFLVALCLGRGGR